MKSLSSDEINALNTISQDVSLTIENRFSSFDNVFRNHLKSIIPIFVALYFKSINHDIKNPNWKNSDKVFPINNYSNIIKNLVEVHAGYTDFDNLENYLKDHNFEKEENSFAEAIGESLVSKDFGDNHNRHYYIVLSEFDLFNNLSALEYIEKNKLKNIIIIVFTRSENNAINKENRLNGRLISLGFDTLVISGESPVYVCEAITYAKKIGKPTIILANVN